MCRSLPLIERVLSMKKRPSPIKIAVGLCILSLIFMAVALSLGKTQIAQPFTPPPFDTTATQGTPEVPDHLGWQELDAKVFKVNVCGEVMVDELEADVWFASPESNTVWLKMRILDASGSILGETGLIRPGEYVRSVWLEKIPENSTITIKIMAYEPNTYHSAGSATLTTKLSRKNA